MKVKTKEELEDDLKSLARKRDKQIIEIDSIQKQIEHVAEQLYVIDPDHVKVECFQCRGEGIITDPNDNKRKKCPVCSSRGYVWMKIYKKRPKVEKE